MDNGTQEVQFQSQMNFLLTYSESYQQKTMRAKYLQERLGNLKPMVEESTKIQEELEDLNKSIRLDEKFLISMNDMVMRNTGQPIDNGPMFNQKSCGE